MKVAVMMKNGAFTSIPCVHWHPTVENQVGTIQAGLWVSMADISRHVEQVNAYRKSISCPDMIQTTEEYVNDIEYAEAPFSVYADSEQEEPWRHYGLCVREIPQHGDPSYWNNH